MSGWRTVPLAEVAAIERASVQPDDIESGTPYVGLEHIENGGRLLGSSLVSAGDLASSKFRFTNRHVLYGKLRPYLSKIFCPEFSGICSTDILPILPGPKVDRRYLFHFLRQPSMVEFAASQAVGVNLPRLSPSTLASFSIPLPPLQEQRRITAVLDKADDLRAKRRAALAQLDTLMQSIFLDLLSSKKQFEMAELSKVASLKRGPFGGALKKAIFVASGYKVYEQRNAIDDNFHLGRYFISESKYREMQDFAVIPGDLVVSCSGTLGRVAIAPENSQPGVINQALLRIRVHASKVSPLYLRYVLESVEMQRKLAGISRGTGLQNFPPMNDIRAMRVPVPPTSVQLDFSRRVAALEKLKAAHRASGREMDALFASLQHRAFRGEL